MKANIYKITSSILLIIVAILTVLLIRETKDNVVAKVEDKKIYESEVQKELSNSSYKMAINSLIDKSLIDKAFEDEGYTLNDDDRAKQLEYVKAMDPDKFDLKDKETYEFVSTYAKARKLIEKYSLTDDDLKEFIKSEVERLGSKNITLKCIYGTDEDLKKMDSFKDAKKINTYATEHSLETIENTVFSNINYFGINFDGCSANDIYMYDGNGEIDEDIYSTKKAILIVEKVQPASESILNLKNNKEEIVNAYLSKNYFRAKLKLINTLQNKYEIRTEVK